MANVRTDAPSFREYTKVIAMVDAVGSTRLLEQDAEAFIRGWHGFVVYVRARLAQDGGRMHRSLGDGLMLEFAQARGCVRCALAMLRWLGHSNAGAPRGRQLQVRIGAHLARCVADEFDIYGLDVNVTARLMALASGGEIVVSAALHDGLGKLPGLAVQDLGERRLKHVSRPVRAYRLTLEGPPDRRGQEQGACSSSRETAGPAAAARQLGAPGARRLQPLTAAGTSGWCSGVSG